MGGHQTAQHQFHDLGGRAVHPKVKDFDIGIATFGQARLQLLGIDAAQRSRTPHHQNIGHPFPQQKCLVEGELILQLGAVEGGKRLGFGDGSEFCGQGPALILGKIVSQGQRST